MGDLPKALVEAVRAGCLLKESCKSPLCDPDYCTRVEYMAEGWNAALQEMAKDLDVLKTQYRQLYKRAEGISKAEAFSEAVEIATSLMAKTTDA